MWQWDHAKYLYALLFFYIWTDAKWKYLVHLWHELYVNIQCLEYVQTEKNLLTLVHKYHAKNR